MDNTKDRVTYVGLKKDQKTLRQFFHIFFEDLESVVFHHPGRREESYDRINKRLRPIFMDLAGQDSLETTLEGELAGGRFLVQSNFISFHLDPGQLDNYREKFTDLLADNFPVQLIDTAGSIFTELELVFLSDQVSLKQWKGFAFPSVHPDRPQIDIFKIYHNVLVKIRARFDPDRFSEDQDPHKILGLPLLEVREALLKKNDEFFEMMSFYISSRSMFFHFEPRLKAARTLKSLLVI